MSRRLLLACFVLLLFAAKASHNRAGEIIYKRIEPFSKNVGGVVVPYYHYLITVIKYTNHGDAIADRCDDTIFFGDGDKGIARRTNDNGSVQCNCGFDANGKKVGCGVLISTEANHVVKLNTYTITHVYPGPGHYLVRTFDPNRNEGIENIPNSLTVPFYLESLLIINANVGANSSPVFAFPPIDKACVGYCFEHNPGAYDPDPEDSLSFELTVPRGVGGNPVPNYTYPDGSFTIDHVTGEIRWCSPPKVGEYNMAFITYEWRKNTNGQYQLWGYVLRDMQVVVENCQNNPPTAIVPPDTCVEAGTIVKHDIIVDDPDNDVVTIQGGGGPFSGIPPLATLSQGTINTAPGPGISKFQWNTTCDHIRKLPYQVTIKLTDDGTGTGTIVSVKQVRFYTFNIKVIPPSIKNIKAEPLGSAIHLSWSIPSCNPSTNILTGFHIYRRNSCDSLQYDPCKNGVLATPGYTLVDEMPPSATSYTDNNHGDGLVVGQNYNYIVTGVYEDGTETFASAGVCAKLVRDVPVFLNVDIKATSSNSGKVFLRWTRPLKTPGNFDTIQHPGPYEFRLQTMDPGGNIISVFTSTAPYLYLLDTAFTHNNVNTESSPLAYQIEFMSQGKSMGFSQKASSVFLKADPDDGRISLSWIAKTPWINYRYNIYRKDPGATSYSLITTTSLSAHVDSAGIINGNIYCYYVVSEGAYSDPSIYKPLTNASQELCQKAVDITPPCTPTLSMDADCIKGFVSLTWTEVDKVCARSNDLAEYRLYYKETIEGAYNLIYKGRSAAYFYDGLDMISGCYAVEAVDTNNNISTLSEPFCVDNCPEFELPNIFTPNDDGANDFFQAVKVRQIKEISLFVVDRWGNTVFKTTDPYFKWNGESMATHVKVSEGAFYYICDVYEPRLRGVVKRTIKGTVNVAR